MSRANGYTSYRGSSRQARPSSADLVDLHVYIVPPDIWREQYNNLLNQNVTETISAGIIRVHPEVKVYSLREEIDQQIGAELLPQDYVFLKSVGRSITRLKPKQEYQLKAKHFIPPQAYAPELFLLEVGPGDSRGSTGPHSPSIGQPYNSQSYHHPESEDGSQTGKNRHLRSTTSPYRYSPLPKIKQSRTSSKGESPRYDYGSHNGDTRGSREGLRGSQSRVSSRARSPPQTDRPQQANKPHHTDRPPHTDRPSYSDKPPSQPRSRPNSQPRDRPISDNRIRQRSRERSRASSRHQSPARQGSPTTGHNSASPTPSSDRERDHDHHHRERDRRHQDRSPHKQEKYDGTYTNHTNEDSGINVITPEEHYEALDRRKPEEHRQTEVHARLQPTHDDDDDERQRRLQEEREREEWERRRREEEERRRKEEEEKRRREEEDQQREDDERRRREEEREQMTKDQKLTGSDEDLNRFPSPPPMQVHDIHPERETESAKRRRKEEKERLLRELEAAREARRVVERQREELVKKAKAMQSKTQNRRNHARDVWKKRYFEEKKRTPPLEEQCNRLRHELDIIHRKLMNTLEGPSKDKSTRAGDMKPSQKVGAYYYDEDVPMATSGDPRLDAFYRQPVQDQGSQTYRVGGDQPYVAGGQGQRVYRVNPILNQNMPPGDQGFPSPRKNPMGFLSFEDHLNRQGFNKAYPGNIQPINSTNTGIGNTSNNYYNNRPVQLSYRSAPPVYSPKDIPSSPSYPSSKISSLGSPNYSLPRSRYSSPGQIRGRVPVVRNPGQGYAQARRRGPFSPPRTYRQDYSPTRNNNYKIQATRLTHEIDDMRRRLENAKMKLTAEMKLRNQAETELRALRAELTQKKIHLTLTRNQQLAALTPGSSNQDLYMMPALTPKS